MKKNLTFSFIILFVSLILVSCEHLSLDKPRNIQKNSVVFNLDNFEQVPFTNGKSMSKSSTTIDQVSSIINLAIFSDSGKVVNQTQKIGDANFGHLSVSLANGTYHVVIIAHNGAGSATISTPDKITFPSNKVTDTFYYYGDINVQAASENSIELKRAVAKVRIIAQDAKPSTVSQMKFYYTGGSSTFDAVTGYGIVDSRQTEYRAAGDSITGKPSQYEIYTFPHAETGTLNLIVTALDSLGTTFTERVFSAVPVQQSVVTQYTGNFFTSPNPSNTFSLTADDAWTQNNYQY